MRFVRRTTGRVSWPSSRRGRGLRITPVVGDHPDRVTWGCSQSWSRRRCFSLFEPAADVREQRIAVRRLLRTRRCARTGTEAGRQRSQPVVEQAANLGRGVLIRGDGDEPVDVGTLGDPLQGTIARAASRRRWKERRLGGLQQLPDAQRRGIMSCELYKTR